MTFLYQYNEYFNLLFSVLSGFESPAIVLTVAPSNPMADSQSRIGARAQKSAQGNPLL